MSNIKLKQLSKIGYTNNQARTIALNIISKFYKHHTSKEVEDLLTEIKTNPQNYVNDEILNKIAFCFIEKAKEQNFQCYELNSEAKPVKTYGAKHIDTTAKQQMDIALKLPIAVKGALMPDAHAGYGLPIGGVLATENAVIPYGIGVDIGCRMAMTIFDANEKAFNQYHYQCKTALKEWTHFGMEGGLDVKQDHEIFENVLFNEFPLIKQLKGKAFKQLGSSGSGNHFVEWGLLDMQFQNKLNLKEGKYVALLSHSGSRGLGANIAMHYFQEAMNVCKLPSYAKHLAWLDLDSALGQEYWLAMTLAGDYAKACHDVIHKNLTKQVGFTPILTVENHHNFAWKEMVDGKELIVHRKGATPANENEFGIIPGSMVHKGFLVSGKGNDLSLNSASHGAGRAMSRAKAKSTNTVSGMKKMLADHNITLIGGSTEEAPNAYKDIEQVMFAQQDLVNIEGIFQPKIVRMNKE
jgi:tRNA-splicing ligase RtcB